MKETATQTVRADIGGPITMGHGVSGLVHSLGLQGNLRALPGGMDSDDLHQQNPDVSETRRKAQMSRAGRSGDP
jgi:hypothetical protein